MEVSGQIIQGSADGIKCDEDGNIWSSAGWGGKGYDGVHIFEPNEESVLDKSCCLKFAQTSVLG